MRHGREAEEDRRGRTTRLVPTGNGVKVSARVFCACLFAQDVLRRVKSLPTKALPHNCPRYITPLLLYTTDTHICAVKSVSEVLAAFGARVSKICRCDGATVVQVRHSAFSGRMFEPGLSDIRCGHLKMELIWRSVLGKRWGDVRECLGAFAVYFCNTKAYLSITSASLKTTARA
jgi:hypothetical protein